MLRSWITRCGRISVASVVASSLACVPPEPPADGDPDGGASENARYGELPTSLTREEGIPVGGVELGWGWDSRRGEVVPSRCIQFSPVLASGQVATMNMHEVSDQSELMDSVGVSASVAVKTMFASGSAQASFAKSSKVSSTSTNLVLEATVDNGVLFVGPVRPPAVARSAFPSASLEHPEGVATSEGAGPARGSDVGLDAISLQPWAERLARSDAEVFRKRCGDSFVSTIYSGAKLLAMIQFSSSSKEEKQTISAQLKAQYGPAQFKAKTDAQKAHKAEDKNLEVTYLQVGGGSGIIPTDQDALKEKLRDLAIEAARDPHFHSMNVTPYERLPAWTGGALGHDRDEDEIVANYYWLLTSLYGDIETILGAAAGEYSSKTGLQGEDLRAFQDKVLALRGTLYDVMRAKRDGELPGSLPSVAELRLMPSASLALADLKRPAADTPESRERWFELFNRALRGAIPDGNPNALKLVLPVPEAAIPANADDEALRMAVVNWYVRPQAIRMCGLDPTDNACLSNEEMKALAVHVPVPAG